MKTYARWENAPQDITPYLGFVYRVVSPEGKFYIGKKLFWSAVKRKPLKGKFRARRQHKESDWKKYWGSSKDLLHDFGKSSHGWRREILCVCKSKWEMAYMELFYQLQEGVLFREDSYNGIVNVRLSKLPKDSEARVRVVALAGKKVCNSFNFSFDKELVT